MAIDSQTLRAVCRLYRHFWILTLIGYGVGSVLTAVVVPLLYKRMMDVVSADAIHA